MRYYSDDPVRDAERYMEDQDRRLERLPVCCECGEPVQDDTAYESNGECICVRCMEDNHLKGVEYFQ